MSSHEKKIAIRIFIPIAVLFIFYKLPITIIKTGNAKTG